MNIKTKREKVGKFWVRVQAEGQVFCCRGIVQHTNGRRVAETRSVPHGMSHVALELARDLALELSKEVRS